MRRVYKTRAEYTSMADTGAGDVRAERLSRYNTESPILNKLLSLLVSSITTAEVYASLASSSYHMILYILHCITHG